ncbi:BTG-domain-containing protein [Neocallimastix lanati (nom. inval.)]|uniref:BTG-domain-containing protein n=1 Tax=Neocallimastix californiae TaxID=1754190 RepID=A0A1Y2CH48_9FUNG|nr:BTG-domain-containing protein [Neocallimastix sp. JGI-2020a]ORY46256.1 BTG-domain-containing protein [Neocallimastix californiae]|eukprot:ORY46256.1 BTG-domain-containing protein [Neocallimastix californiae]
MLNEIQTAIDFIVSYLKNFKPVQLEVFKENLNILLKDKYFSHWDDTNPLKGSAYRSISINDGRIDHLILIAAYLAGMDVTECFPNDLIIWVDPSNVCYRQGSDYSSICTLYKGNTRIPQKVYNHNSNKLNTRRGSSSKSSHSPRTRSNLSSEISVH